MLENIEEAFDAGTSSFHSLKLGSIMWAGGELGLRAGTLMKEEAEGDHNSDFWLLEQSGWTLQQQWFCHSKAG